MLFYMENVKFFFGTIYFVEKYPTDKLYLGTVETIFFKFFFLIIELYYYYYTLEVGIIICSIYIMLKTYFYGKYLSEMFINTRYYNNTSILLLGYRLTVQGSKLIVFIP